MVNCDLRQQIGLRGFCLLIMAFVCLPVQLNAAAEADPLTQIKQSVDQVVAILHDDDNSEEKWVTQKEEIIEIIDKRFDSEELALRVLAKHWRKRTDQEKAQFIDLFSSVLENTYISRVKSYATAEVIFEKQIVKGNKAMVYSFINYNNQEIPINYRLKKKNGEWFVYDIMIEGVSLVNNYRKQFSQIIKREKYEGLVRRMEEKIQETKEKDSTEN